MDSIDKKAEKLIAKFNEIESCEKHYSVESDGRICTHIAKQCAIICVDEIIASYKNKSPNYENETYWHPIDYWQQVKERLLAKQ